MTHNKSDHFWNHPSDYLAVTHRSLLEGLYPAIRKVLSKRLEAEERLLDYGCGDGRCAETLLGLVDISLYDSSPFMLSAAVKRLGPSANAVRDLSSASGAFDAVLMSLVLVCIEDEDQWTATIQEANRLLRPGGTWIMAETHPCFRNGRFSDFVTEFSEGVPFDYFDEGRGFEVQIGAPDEARPVRFRDYHRSVSLFLNTAATAGFRLVSVVEVADTKDSGSQLVPPFWITVMEKNL